MRSVIPAEDNPALREKAREIPLADIPSARIQDLIADMKELLSHEEYGVAMAASQVGEPLALFIVSGKALARHAALNEKKDAPEGKDAEDASGAGDEDEEDIPALPDQVYINPVMTRVSKKKTDKHEGCLSVRGKWGMVPRAEKASVRAYDEHGKKFTRGASGFLAHIFQHEMDHLFGILYTDKATELFDDKEIHHEQAHD